MKLRDIVSQVLIDPQKLTGYALNPNHDDGYDKSILFQRHLGITRENYELLLSQIQEKVMDTEAISLGSNEYGERYRVDILVIGVKSEQQEIVRTGWIVKPGKNIAQLTTLYIPRRK